MRPLIYTGLASFYCKFSVIKIMTVEISPKLRLNDKFTFYFIIDYSFLINI